jgi:hypothetical protein
LQRTLLWVCRLIQKQYGNPKLILGISGMRTTSGSVALVNSIPKGDAPVVAKLRAQGAIILGKANLTEFGNFKGDIPWGWSSSGGQTQSAYGPGTFPGELGVGGCSSGSAVGVSAGFAAAAIAGPKSTDPSPNRARRLRYLASRLLSVSFPEKASWELPRAETPSVRLQSRLMMPLSFSALWPDATHTVLLVRDLTISAVYLVQSRVLILRVTQSCLLYSRGGAQAYS